MSFVFLLHLWTCNETGSSCLVQFNITGFACACHLFFICLFVFGFCGLVVPAILTEQVCACLPFAFLFSFCIWCLVFGIWYLWICNRTGPSCLVAQCAILTEQVCSCLPFARHRGCSLEPDEHVASCYSIIISYIVLL